MRHPQRSFLAGFLLALFLSVGISFAAPAFAQDVDLESFAELAGFSTSASITVIIARLIRTAISLVGVIAVSFFIYGGFMWMTAGGSADKISSAKKILTNSIIGIVLVFSSFAIVSFLLGALVGSSDGSVSSSSSGSSSYSDSSSSSLFYLSSVNTDCSESLQNLELQFVFTKSVDDDALDSGGISVTAAGGSEVAGTFDRSGRTVTFTPEQTCEELGYSDYFCFDAETSYSIALDSTILESGTGSSLSCSDEYPCSFSFTTGTGIDLNDPSVSIDSPDDGSSVVVGDIEMIQAQTADDTGVSTVYFYVVDDDDAVYASGVDFSSAGELLGGDDLNFFFTDEAEEWDSSGYTTNETYDVWAKGVDCAGNSDTASKVEIVLRAVNCSNGILDAEYEDDVDCGGDSSSEYYCGACEGGSCEESSECASGRCEEGECVDSPKISSVSPGDGAVGNLITISGEGFGDDTGVVTFLGAESGDELEVSSYVCDGTTQWSDDEVIIQVPSGVVDGPIQIQNIDGDSERTDDDYGATISDFDANAIQRPGICLLDPSTDTVGESVAVSGIGFGDTQGTSTFYFTGYETSSYVSWDDEGLDVVVPNANAGTYRTSVFTGDYQCTDESGEATGSSCAADSDCDEEAGETCGGTSWCSETLELCSDDDDCGEDGGTCESLRVGSNKVQFVVTDTSSDSTPIISVVNSGWQACDGGTEDSESCSTDDDCGGGGTCEDALNWGPSEQYVTIFGSNFGTSVGTVYFENEALGYEALGDTDFPDRCSEDYWHDTYITVKVPEEYLTESGDPIEYGSHNLSIVRQDSVESDSVEFVVIDGAPGPSICDINPSAGPIGTEVTVYGERFTSDGDVEFYSEVVSDLSDAIWSTESIASIPVPTGSVTGPVYVTDEDGYTSNAVSFEIGSCNESPGLCSAGEECCGDGSCSTACFEDEAVDSHYAYLISTATIPETPSVLVQCDLTTGVISPSVWEGWTDADETCLNSAITATFDTKMDKSSINRGTVTVEICLDEDTDSSSDTYEECLEWDELTPSGFSKTNYTFNWYPSLDSGGTPTLEVDSWYVVTLDGGGEAGDIQAHDSVGGAYLPRDFSWEFRTSSASDFCEVGNVNVTPTEYTSEEEDEEIDYLAQLVAADDDCQVLTCEGYTLSWDSNDSAAVIEDAEPGEGVCENIVIAAEETEIGVPAEIEATVLNAENDPSDTAELIVNFLDPEIDDYAPDCETACINALPFAVFNTDMDWDTISESSVTLYSCEDALCESSELTEIGIIDTVSRNEDENRFEINFTDEETLEANTWYRVVVDGDSVFSSSGVELSDSGSNYGTAPNQYFADDFSWKFKTKDSDVSCGIDSIELSPDEALMTYITERQEFDATAIGAPDDCNANGQALQGGDFDWSSWSATDSPDNVVTEVVAYMIEDGAIELSSDLPDWCTSECINAGASIGEGDAVCGDGEQDTDYEECDDGNSTSGDGCSSSCLLEGGEACSYACAASGADCSSDSDCYETCTDSVCSISGTACATDDGSDCLFAEATGDTCGVVESSCCGDGSVDSGEECDDGGNESADGCSAVCLNEGSRYLTGAECGNASVDHSDSLGGEDCDDGNTNRGDGCSSQCLYEGSSEFDSDAPVCGNASIEDGEDCDDGNTTDGDGCSVSCVNEGTSACVYVCSDSGASCSSDADCSDDGSATCGEYSTPCCGNSDTETGEDCDGGADGEDGCSSVCLAEGSSAHYESVSFCGDGVVGTGEECETESDEFVVTSYGVAVVDEGAVVEVDEETGYAISTITATANEFADGSGDDVAGTAELSLECSCTTGDSCGVSGVACGAGSCCFVRPEKGDVYPAGADLCRNTAIWVEFDSEMDAETFDLTSDDDGDGEISEAEFNANIYLDLVSTAEGRVRDSEDCPSGYTALAYDSGYPADSGIVTRGWYWVKRFVSGLFGGDASASSTYGCYVEVEYEVAEVSGGQRVYLRYDALLEENAKYKLHIVGDDDATDETNNGVLDEHGVSLCLGSGCSREVFRTTFDVGEEICELDSVEVEDSGRFPIEEFEDPSAEFFSEIDEEHVFLAAGYTYRSSTGQYEEISPIASIYDWSWAMDSSLTDGGLTDVVELAAGDTGEDAETTFVASGADGTENVIAIAEITVDAIHEEEDSTVEDQVSGSVEVLALLCENPWPEIGGSLGFPFVETEESTNFSFYYCRDAGDEDDTSDDLPALSDPIDVTSLASAGILQEVIFKVEGSSDAIGVRVLPNDEYLSASAWATAQEFTGNFTATSLDGYDAVTSGTTLYVAAANQEEGAGVIYPNMYVVSYNDDAGDEAGDIFAEVLENWRFNANDDVVTNVNLCEDTSGYITDDDTDYVSCSWDGGCLETCEDSVCSISGDECSDDDDCSLAESVGATCSADKAKLTRDMNRLTDITDIIALLDTYGEENMHCAVTKDQQCSSDSDCPGDEECVAGYPEVQSGTFVPSITNSVWSSWSAVLANDVGTALPTDPINEFYNCTEDGYDEASCWNGGAGTFVCPDGSHLYAYQGIGGEAYRLNAVLESDVSAYWSYGIDSLTNGDGEITIEYPDGFAPSTLAAGFATSPEFCDGTTWGDSVICGDGVQGPTEDCEIGDTTSLTCTDSSGTSGLITASCVNVSDVCVYQDASEAEAAGSECLPYECGNGVVEDDEQCDDGALNGTYGHCGDDCTAESGFYCGDGYLAGGEECDCGTTGLYDYSDSTAEDFSSWAYLNGCDTSNGQYSDDITTSCTYNCLSPGLACGDEEVNGDEECDGDYEDWTGALCEDGATACTSDSDCDSGSCGVTYEACGLGDVCVDYDDAGDACVFDIQCDSGDCSDNECTSATDIGDQCASDSSCQSESCPDFDYELFRYRTCDNTCEWPAFDDGEWSECVGGTQLCGNGILEGAESCDDGNDSNNDSCLNTCELNVCGDDYVYSGVESCDNGSDNGTECDASYEGTCNYCNVSCQYKTLSGDFCGDGEVNGDEWCDGEYALQLTNYNNNEGTYGSCDTWGDYTTSTSGDTYYCAWLGVCNGGDNHGDVCTLDYEDYESGDTPLEYEGYTRSAPACDGECVAPTCADNCGSSCPTSYQTTGLLVQSELAGAAKEDQVNLFSYQNSDGDSPDNAAIFVPACEAGSQIRVDIDRDDAELADIDIVFVTDLSKSMNEDPTTGSAGSSGSRNIDYVVNATKNAVADLFDAYDGGGATIRVGLVSYTSKYYSTSSSIEFCGNTLSSLTNDGAATDYALSGGTSESSIMSSLDDYKTCVSSSSGASPAQKGLETALDRFRGSTADVKIVVLLSDGGILINEDFRDAADSDGDGFANHRCEGTSESAGGSTYTGYQACVIQMADLIEDNDDVSFYSATITSSGSKMGRMAHVSSNECDWDDLQSVDDCTGDFAYAGETEEAIEEMYDDIVDSILGTTVYLTATDESGDTTTTIGGIDYGNSVELPFPDGFVCQDESQVIPLRHEFYGGAGSMSFSNFQFTYCPYVDSESSGGSGSSGSSSEEEEEEEEEEEPYCGDDTIDFTDGESCDLTSFPVGCFVASENPDDRSLEFCSATSTDDCTCSDSSAVEVSATSGARTGYCNGGSAFASDGSGTEYDYTDAVCIASGTTSTTLYGCGEDTTVSTEGTCDLVVCEDDCTIAADEPTSYTATHSTTGLACGDGYIDIAEGEYCDASDFQIYCWDSDADPSARRGYACGTTTLTDCVCDSGYAYVASSLGYCSGGSAIVGGTRYNYNGAICVNATSTRPTIHGCGEDSVSPRTREGTCVADVCDGDCTGSTFSGDDEEWGS